MAVYRVHSSGDSEEPDEVEVIEELELVEDQEGNVVVIEKERSSSRSHHQEWLRDQLVDTQVSGLRMALFLRLFLFCVTCIAAIVLFFQTIMLGIGLVYVVATVFQSPVAVRFLQRAARGVWRWVMITAGSALGVFSPTVTAWMLGRILTGVDETDLPGE